MAGPAALHADGRPVRRGPGRPGRGIYPDVLPFGGRLSFLFEKRRCGGGILDAAGLFPEGPYAEGVAGRPAAAAGRLAAAQSLGRTLPGRAVGPAAGQGAGADGGLCGKDPAGTGEEPGAVRRSGSTLFTERIPDVLAGVPAGQDPAPQTGRSSGCTGAGGRFRGRGGFPLCVHFGPAGGTVPPGEAGKLAVQRQGAGHAECPGGRTVPDGPCPGDGPVLLRFRGGPGHKGTVPELVSGRGRGTQLVHPGTGEFLCSGQPAGDRIPGRAGHLCQQAPAGEPAGGAALSGP